MAKGFRLELNSAGVVALLNDPGVAADIERRANAVAAAAPGEWSVTTYATDRASAIIRTVNREAMRAAAEDPGRVIGAVNAGRG